MEGSVRLVAIYQHPKYMEHDQYLTDELKDYYSQDFQKLLDYNESDFWNIDEEIKEDLKLINSNSCIQTLYSKKFTHANDSISTEPTSYLEITFKKGIESKLLTVLTEIKNSLTSHFSVVTLDEADPCDNANYKADSKISLGCVTNPDYFRVKHFRIEIESSEMMHHDLFWNFLGSKLSSFFPPLK